MINFGIISDGTFLGYKRSVDVRLNYEISEEELEAIAWRIKKMDRFKYGRTFIGYYLPGMKIDAGYWATTHFTPDLEVRILGKQQVELGEVDGVED